MGRKRGRKVINFEVDRVMTNQQLPETYCINEHLGTEDRSTEFKNGPGFIRHGFREQVAKYVCGFVNSQQNGKLLIGVNDKGEVSGYDCNHREEDNIRREVDEAVKDLVPAIFPEDYSVKFVQVADEHGNPMGNVKVIGIIVNGAMMSKKDVLYQNKQGVFMRRDGSIQELKASDIQEWDRRKFQQRYQPEIDKLKKNEQNFVSDLKNKDNELRQLHEKLEQKDKELKRREEALEQLSVANESFNEFEQNKAQEDLQNKDQKIRELEKLVEQKNEELRRGNGPSARQPESNHVSDDVSQHRPEQDGAQGAYQLNERFDRLEEMLSRQKKSRVCVIS